MSFKLKLHNPSKIAQLQELEHLKTKLETADAAKAVFSKRWIAENVLSVSEEELVRIERERFYDAKLEAILAKTAELAGETTGAESAEPAAGGGGELGDALGDVDLGGEELGGTDTEPEPEPEPAAGGGEEDVLLATPAEAGPPPAKRDEPNEYHWMKVSKKDIQGKEHTTTSKSKGKWYTPAKLDGRASAARGKNMKSQAGHSQGGRRGTFPGQTGIDSLVRGIVSEDKSNYNVDVENDIFNSSAELKELINSLEKKDGETKTQ